MQGIIILHNTFKKNRNDSVEGEPELQFNQILSEFNYEKQRFLLRR